MGVYDPLTRHLEAMPQQIWNTNFAEIEQIISRPLPKSAYEYRPWWANQRDGHHSQAKAWRDAGWEVRQVDLAHRTARFEKTKPGKGGAAPAAPPHYPTPPDLDDLLAKAATLTGEPDRAELIRLALETLIRREAAAGLAALGGTMPDAEAPPRRRFD